MNQVPATRRQVVDRAREGWIRRLIDLSRRNNLLYYRDLKSGTLDLTEAEGRVFQSLLAGSAVSLSQLLPEADEVRTAAVARELFRRAQTNLEEKGLQTLFLALGMATWIPSDGGRPSEAAVLLLPVALEVKGLGRNVAIKRSGEVTANLVLLHVLDVEHGVKLDPEALLSGDPDEEEENTFDPAPVFDRLRAACVKLKGFNIQRRAVVGNFSFQKMAMVQDLRDRGGEMAAHDLIAAIAGDPATVQAVKAGQADLDPAELDKAPPESEFHILDADSTQQRAAVMVARGQSTVIQGPPGTGKSQTIANLIAALSAAGKRLLFVAEKRAALEVVQRRLNSAGLGHLALDLHGADLSRQEIMQKVAQNLSLVRDSLPVDGRDLHRRFVDCRGKLVEHVRRMHTRRLPAGLSAYDLQGRLLRLPKGAATALRWREPDLGRLTVQTASEIEDHLAQAAAFSSLFLRTDPSPWTGAHLPDATVAQQAIDLVHRLASVWPALLGELGRVSAAARLQAPATLAEAGALISLVYQVGRVAGEYRVELFTADLPSLHGALAPASRGLFAHMMAWLFDGRFRAAVRQMRGLRRDGAAAAPADLFAAAGQAADLSSRWRKLATDSGAPAPVAGVESTQQQMQAMLQDARRLAELLGRPGLDTSDLGAFGQLVAGLHDDTSTPYQIAALSQFEAELSRRGAGAMMEELRRSKPAPAEWHLRFRYAWLASCLDKARAEDPGLAGFHGRTHERFVEEFWALDRKRIQLAADRVRRTHAEHAIAVMNAHPDQESIVRREAEKKTRHQPLRKLLRQAPDVLTALFPCWMASPLSVSQLMDADRRYFDVVLFDEASQVLPEDAVPALLRGSQVVVAGDEHQLPPTTFFADGAGDDQEAEELNGATEGYESVLKLTASFLPQRWLQWHYRSEDEALIAFSNRHIYQERLVTFPGSGGAKPVTHVLVDQAPDADGQEESSSREVQQMVQLVLEHARQRPAESLGVITMGMKHSLRVQAALDDAVRSRPDLEDFFDATRPERFFIKNLERVQGDERDAIILSVGYGKDRSGKLPYRFGPLLYDGGERRLNVAVTRARKRMTLVSSFSHLDMDPARSKSKGVELLRLYLQYASSQGRDLGDRGEAPVPLNDFEEDVRSALSARGVPLLSQWGVSSYRIDLVAQHPHKRGRFVLAIECDGASYHSAPTARDRDRLRQQHLEALGWRFHRIWSTDWFQRRNEELERAVAAYQTAVAAADAEDRAPAGRDEPATHVPLQAYAAVQSSRPPARAPRPFVPKREKIDDYLYSELDGLVRWIRSDGKLRTDDEIIDEMVRELGFSRRGSRIVEAVRDAIRRTGR